MKDFINKEISNINSKFFCMHMLSPNNKLGPSYVIPKFGWSMMVCNSCLCYVDSNNKSLISLLRIQWEK